MNSVALLVLLTFGYISGLKIKFNPCASPLGKIDEVISYPCTTHEKFECAFQQGNNQTIIITFTPNVDIQSAHYVISPFVGGIPVSFSLPKADVCGNGLSCPLKANQQYNYTTSMQIIFPPMNLLVQFELKDPQDQTIACFKAPVMVLPRSSSNNPAPPSISNSLNLSNSQSDISTNLFGVNALPSFITNTTSFGLSDLKFSFESLKGLLGETKLQFSSSNLTSRSDQFDLQSNSNSSELNETQSGLDSTSNPYEVNGTQPSLDNTTIAIDLTPNVSNETTSSDIPLPYNSTFLPTIFIPNPHKDGDNAKEKEKSEDHSMHHDNGHQIPHSDDMYAKQNESNSFYSTVLPNTNQTSVIESDNYTLITSTNYPQNVNSRE